MLSVEASCDSFQMTEPNGKEYTVGSAVQYCIHKATLQAAPHFRLALLPSYVRQGDVVIRKRSIECVARAASRDKILPTNVVNKTLRGIRRQLLRNWTIGIRVRLPTRKQAEAMPSYIATILFFEGAGPFQN